MVERVVIGVDGGGTRLRAAVATDAGELLGIGESGAGNYHDVGADQVRSNIDAAVARAWTASRISPCRAEAIFLGLGSVVTHEDRAIIRGIVRELSLAPDDCIGVDHDLRVALMGGLAGEAGIVLIAGTGSSCYGRDGQGRSWQAGGWGPVLDDPGSSYWLGRQAMIAAVRDHDGRGEATGLHARVVTALELSDIRQILRRVELEGMTRAEIAALARIVTDMASEGDAVARAIIDRGAEELATMVTTVAAKLDMPRAMNRVPVTVTGGLTNAREVFMDPLANAIRRRVRQAVVVEPKLPPVLGAVLLAIELTGLPVSPGIVNRLIEDHSAVKQACSAT